MGFCGFNGFAKSRVTTGSIKLNVFTQLAEPNTKDGIWIKTNSKYKNILVDNRMLNTDGVWLEIISPPSSTAQMHCVYFKGAIHAIVGNSSSTIIYKLNYDNTWTQVTSYTHGGTQNAYCCVCVYNDEIHVIGAGTKAYYTMHSIWNGNKWTSKTLPYEMSRAVCCVYNGELHVLGNDASSGTLSAYTKRHYKFNGNSWSSVSTLPYNFSWGSCTVYNGELHILGGSGYTTEHYKFDGSTWTTVSTLPMELSQGNKVVTYNNCIHIFNGTSHYKFDGYAWSNVGTVPFTVNVSNIIAVNNSIVMLSSSGLGSFTTPDKVYKHNTVILKKSNSLSGVYTTAFLEPFLSVNDGDGRLATGFDDVWYFDETSFDDSCEMYYGTGNAWVKFKN